MRDRPLRVHILDDYFPFVAFDARSRRPYLSVFSLG